MKILQKSMGKNKQDPFWYEGTVAKTKDFILDAVGDIHVTYKGNSEWDDNARAWALKMNWKDKDLKKFEFLNNNWFEILEIVHQDDGTDVINGCEGEVLYDYDGAIKCLKQMQKEKEQDED